MTRGTYDSRSYTARIDRQADTQAAPDNHSFDPSPPSPAACVSTNPLFTVSERLGARLLQGSKPASQSTLRIYLLHSLQEIANNAAHLSILEDRGHDEIEGGINCVRKRERKRQTDLQTGNWKKSAKTIPRAVRMGKRGTGSSISI